MIAWASGTVIAVSILIALVLVLRGPVARTFGARAAYALWLAPGLRAVMPSLPAGTVPISAPGAAAPIHYFLAQVAAPDDRWLTLPLIVGAVWLGGAIVFLGFHAWRHHRFLGQVLANGRPLEVADMRYDVVASAFVDGPLATGLIHPLIVVPADFEQRFSAEQQRFALWHEQLHHRRGDIWASAAALILASVLWFNPLAYLALGAFRRDMEAACDETLLADAGPAAAPAYAETILRCAAGPVPHSLCALTTIDELKGRLMMLKTNHGSVRRFTGLLLAGGVIIAGLALAMPAAADDSQNKQVSIKKIEIREVKGGKDHLNRADLGDIEKAGANCPGEKVEIAADGGGADRKEQVKFILCGDKSEGRAGLIKGLEKAVVDMDKQDSMPASVKADMLAKIRAKIESLRAGG